MMTNCINCGFEIKNKVNYCPNCGQKVDNNNLAVRVVIKEFFENYLSLDTRFGRSIKPFLFKPGFLTQKFINGKRRSFANPFRLYIISSIFFFFCLTNYINKADKGNSAPIIDIGKYKLHTFNDLEPFEIDILNEELTENTINKINLNKDTSFYVAYQSLKPLRKKKIIKALDEKSLARLNLLSDTTLLNTKTSFYLNKDENLEDASLEIDLDRIDPYIKDKRYSNKMLYDSLSQGREISFTQEILFKQSIKFARADETEIRRTIFGNLSLGMFVLIPLFALFLKLFYSRENKFYVAHLIHTVYLQSFAFLLFGLCLFLAVFFPFFSSLFNNLIGISIVIFIVYFIKSMRKVYRQSKARTIIKSFTLFGIYFFLSMFSLLGEMLIAFLLF